MQAITFGDARTFTRLTQGIRTALNSGAMSLLCFASVSLGAHGEEASNSADAEAQVERVVVKGQKIDRTLQETPNSVDVITAQDVIDYNLNDLTDVLAQTANVTSTFGGTGFTIRGIANTNVTGTGTSDLATTFVDGAPMPREATFTGPLNLWDLEQIEVLRGPQSTLQGRNTLAGAIMIKTADPTHYWTGNTRLQYFDENNEQRLGVAFGGPVIEDELAFRIAAEVTSSDGFIFNPTRNEHISDNESTLVRAKLLYEPSALPDLRILLTHTFDKRKFGDDTSVFDAPDAWGNRQSFANDPIEDESEINLTVLTIDYDINDEWSLVSLSTYDETTRERFRDGDLSAQPILTNSLHNEPSTFTNEFRFLYQGDALSGVFGTFYSDLDATDQVAFTRLTLFPESLGLQNLLVAPPEFGGFGLDPQIAGLVLAEYAQGVLLDTTLRSPIEIETFAVYSDFTWDINDQWRLFAGFRYDKETQDQNNSQTVTLASDLPDPAAFGPLASIFTGINGFLLADVVNANDSGQHADSDFDAFLPKIGVSYDVEENLNLSFIAQRGYRSGGTGVNGARAEVFTFEQEFTWNYELSLRSEWLDGHLTFNANLFYIDWKDQQVTVFLSENVFDTETQNAGSSSVQGGEIEVNYNVNDNVKVFASYGYSNTEIDEFLALVEGEVLNLAGNEFGNAPQNTFAMGAVYQGDSGFYASVDMNYVDEAFERINQDQSNGDEMAPSRTLLNAKIGYRGDDWGVYLIATNLFDEEYFFNDFETTTGVNAGRFGEPRVIGASLEWSF